MSLKTSSFLNLLTHKEKAKYVDVCWDLLQNAYKAIGGFKSSASKGDLVNDHFLWKLGRKGGRIVAVAVYKKQYGRKRVASATDGSAEGKQVLREIYKEDLSRAWTECSGAVEKTLMNLGGGNFRIPVQYATTLTGKQVQPCSDGYHYVRNIGGHAHEKIIIGTPQNLKIVHVARMLRLAGDPLNGIVVRPEGWEATSDEAVDVLDVFAKRHSMWRGMTQAEYNNTVAKGTGVRSKGSYSLSVEGTQFAEHPADAEGYVNYGRDDPRKTGKPNYLVEVKPDGLRKKRDGYFETAPGEGVPDDHILSVYEFRAEDGAIVAERIR
jgi:hypothetical protein